MAYYIDTNKTLIIYNTTTIADGAFRDRTDFTGISIAATITNIGKESFAGCSAVTSITVDSANSTYYSSGNCIIRKSDSAVVVGCSTSVIPAGVNAIADSAFKGCIKSTSTITIPDGVKAIGTRAFEGCVNLTISVPYDMMYIGDYAFANCSSLYFKHRAKEGTDDKTLLQYLGRGAFANNSNLDGQVKLTDADAVSISDYTFYKCKAGYFDLRTNHQIKYIGDYAFSDSDISENAISNNTIKIGERAYANTLFGGIETFREISIGDYAFSNTPITEVILPNVTHLGEGAFNQCQYLEKVVLGTKLNKISDYLFQGCKKLTTINIPPSISEVGGMAFNGCGSPFIVNYGACTCIPTFGTNVYYGVDSSTNTIIVPDNFFDKWPSIAQNMRKKGLSSTNYIRFVIDKYTFLGEKDTTWKQWVQSDYAKSYCLSDDRQTIWALSRYIILDDRTINGQQLSYAINWPSGDSVKSVGSRSGNATISPDDKIYPDWDANHGTFSIASGAMRSPYWSNERKQWMYNDN